MTTDLEFYMSAPLQTVNLGTPLTYRRFGSGPAIVFVHGWPLNGATYRGLVRRLARHFTCYVPDLPGTGQTPWDPRTRDVFRDFGRLIVRFVDALGLARVAMVAHDSGGGIARFAAAELGCRVTLLALSNTEVPSYLPPLVRLYMMLARVPGMRAIVTALMAQRWFLRGPLGFGPLFADASHAEGDFHEACVKPLLDDRMYHAMLFIRHVDPGIFAELHALHARISAPVVFAWGDADPVFPVERARAMLSGFRDVRGFHVLKGQSLLVHDESPDELQAKFEPLLLELHRATGEAARASA